MRGFSQTSLIALLRGLGQIMLAPNILTGILFLLAIGLNSWLMLCGALLGALTGQWIAERLRCDTLAIEDGLFGFNGALIGLAILCFYQPSPLVISLIIAGAALSSAMLQLLLTRQRWLPPFTLPFISITWVIMSLAESLNFTPATTAAGALASGTLPAILRGLGQIIFQDNAISGALILLALVIHSRTAALWAFAGSTLGLLLAPMLGLDSAAAMLGLYGFNAALVGIALSSRFASVTLILLGICLSLLITWAFAVITLPSLTAPFVLACWAICIVEMIKVWKLKRTQAKTVQLSKP